MNQITTLLKYSTNNKKYPMVQLHLKNKLINIYSIFLDNLFYISLRK